MRRDVWSPTLSAAVTSAWPLSASTLIRRPSTLHYSAAAAVCLPPRCRVSAKKKRPWGSLLSIALTPALPRNPHTHSYRETSFSLKRERRGGGGGKGGREGGGGLHRCAPTTLCERRRMLLYVRIRFTDYQCFQPRNQNQNEGSCHGDSTTPIPSDFMVMAVKKKKRKRNSQLSCFAASFLADFFFSVFFRRFRFRLETARNDCGSLMSNGHMIRL